ncbi:Chromo domain-containing protein [Phanerochaete sordida]|uniref:Chromo domain-containing protein n=1 Tax=Phanerochaete sordida TaxID=48140 RepID=A0A9P3GAL1_9APHY|nr:Chromo domain-containing protein [Phanerochaete sordida]
MAKARNGRAVDEDDVEEVPPSEEEQGSEPEEEEYEIEAILDAKQDAFEGGKLGYLVKWKGYPIESNSWVSEDDAINCQDLIDAFWSGQKKKASQKKAAPAPAAASAAPRKSQVASAASTKPNSAAPSRKRTTPEEEPETISAPPKKRGRPAKLSKPVVSDSEDEAPAKVPAKRGRPSTQAARKDSDAMDEDEEPVYFDMQQVKYRDLDSWENIIDHVDTVERRDDGKLIVYFKLNKKHGNKLCREESSLCREKFPNLLLDFYEHNLRWRPFVE